MNNLEGRIKNLEKQVAFLIKSTSTKNTNNSYELISCHNTDSSISANVMLAQGGLEDVAEVVSVQDEAIAELAEIVSTLVEE